MDPFQTGSRRLPCKQKSFQPGSVWNSSSPVPCKRSLNPYPDSVSGGVMNISSISSSWSLVSDSSTPKLFTFESELAPYLRSSTGISCRKITQKLCINNFNRQRLIQILGHIFMFFCLADVSVVRITTLIPDFGAGGTSALIGGNLQGCNDVRNTTSNQVYQMGR